MTKAEFQAELERLQIDGSLVSWGPSGRDDVFCVEHEAAHWVVYYQERGRIFDRKVFATEAEALEYLIGILRM